MTATLDLTSLRERIARCKDFDDIERGLLLDAIEFVDAPPSDKHVYPRSEHQGPNSPDPFRRRAWEVIDIVPPNAMKPVHRFFLCGAIAGALTAMFHEGKSDKGRLQ